MSTPENWQTWFSTFMSQSGVVHWFTLHLSESRNEAKLEVTVKRPDESDLASPALRVHVENAGRFIALLAKAYEQEPQGLLCLVLHFDDSGGLQGQLTGNSLTDARAGILRVKDSQEILWTAKPSEDHPAARLH